MKFWNFSNLPFSLSLRTLPFRVGVAEEFAEQYATDFPVVEEFKLVRRGPCSRPSTRDVATLAACQKFFVSSLRRLFIFAHTSKVFTAL